LGHFLFIYLFIYISIHVYADGCIDMQVHGHRYLSLLLLGICTYTCMFCR
ncbi:hypothetical protein COCCADRAFT_100128, partial [Bipolaris zeicola 26-R-13]